MQELPKKGNRIICDNFRGLLISDHLGKAASSILYHSIDEPYHKYVPQSQCDAVKKKGSDLGTHTLRTAIDRAASLGLSPAILFVDLVKAFDRVLREIVLGWPQTGEENGVEYLVKLGFERHHVEVLSDEINRFG